MPDYNDFAPLYDFSLVEKAIQTFFVTVAADRFVAPPDDIDPALEQWSPGDLIPFFTAFQAALFQKHRPRIAIDLNNISPINPLRLIIDANEQLQCDWWRARLTFWIVTRPSYAYHTQMRGALLALIAQLAPPSGATQTAPIGVNQYLDKHEVTGCWPSDLSTAVTPQDGHYVSPIVCNLDFAMRPDAWPGGQWTGPLPAPQPGTPSAPAGYNYVPLIDSVTGQLVTLTIRDGVITIAE